MNIEEIYHRIGRQTHELELDDQHLSGGEKGEFLVVLRWASPRTYLSIKANYKKGNELIQFTNDAAQYEKWLVEKLRMPPSRIPKQQSDLVAQIVTCPARVNIDVILDTDAAGFIKEERQSKRLRLICRSTRIDPVADGKPLEWRTTELDIDPIPWTKLGDFRGATAIDLGNNSSTMVTLPSASDAPTKELKVIPEDNSVDAQDASIPTAELLRGHHEIDAVSFPKINIAIGRAALKGQTDGHLILGAKRLLSDPRLEDDTIEVFLSNANKGDAMPSASVMAETARPGHELATAEGSKRIARSEPAEMFIKELFHSCLNKIRSLPKRIAVTHPTTFSPWMVKQVERAVIQGWRWSCGHTEKELKDLAPYRDLIPIVIDEASAAAMYFLMKDWVFPTGKLGRLHYIYPKGLRILVYDCGGGTTDVALLSAKAAFENIAGRERGSLFIKPEGRTGHAFGGDDMTVAVFYLMKAKYARLFDSKVPEPSPAHFKIWLEANRNYRDDPTAPIIDPYDQQIPTKFRPNRLHLVDQRRRRELVREMWREAEDFKLKLVSRDATANIGTALNTGEFCTKLREVRPNIKDSKSEIKISGQELAARLLGEIDRTIQKTNLMLQDRVGEGALDVDQVYVIGNASQFWMIKDRIRESLNVRFIDHRLAKVDRADLKNAVAKGAALALRLKMVGYDVDVNFDSDELRNRMPAELYFGGLVKGDIPVFPENTKYEDMGEQNAVSVPVGRAVSPDQDQSLREFYLHRRWPGERKGEQYLEFSFPEALHGPAKVWFDSEIFRFVAKDQGRPNSESVLAREIPTAMVRAPMQSGEL